MSVAAAPVPSGRTWEPVERRLATLATRARPPRDGRHVFGLALAFNLAMVWMVVFHLGIFVTDAMSRTLHAWQVFFSGDPKLTQIGFIWAPLPTLLQLPLVLLPPLRVDGLSGNVLTALMGALTTVAVWDAVRILGVGRGMGLGLAAAFATNPMIAFYAANGMSEMTATAFTMWSITLLLRWQASRDPLTLILSSFSLGLACLARYDSLVQAALMVLLIPYLRGARRTITIKEERLALTLAYLTPVAAGFLLWVLLNAMIMGDPLHFLRGAYSNAAQIGYQMALLPHIARMAGNPVAIVAFLAQEVTALFPAFSVALLGILAVGWRDRSRVGYALAALALTFPAFQALNFFTGQSAAFLRYFILAIPIGVVLVGYLLSRCPPTRQGAAATAAILLLAGSNVSSAYTMLTSSGWGQWNDIFVRGLIANQPSRTWATERAIAAYLMELTDGTRSILVDDFQGYRIIFFSGQPSRFISSTPPCTRVGHPGQSWSRTGRPPTRWVATGGCTGCVAR